MLFKFMNTFKDEFVQEITERNFCTEFEENRLTVLTFRVQIMLLVYTILISTANVFWGPGPVLISWPRHKKRTVFVKVYPIKNKNRDSPICFENYVDYRCLNVVQVLWQQAHIVVNSK